MIDVLVLSVEAMVNTKEVSNMAKLSLDDIAGSDELCKHCPAYGKVRLCEGSYCGDAYVNYLELEEEEDNA